MGIFFSWMVVKLKHPIFQQTDGSLALCWVGRKSVFSWAALLYCVKVPEHEVSTFMKKRQQIKLYDGLRSIFCSSAC